jgi:hypothetical protein
LPRSNAASKEAHPRVLRFTFRLPTNDADRARLSTLLRMAHMFIDRVAATRLSREAAAKATAARARSAEEEMRAAHKERQEVPSPLPM